MSPGCREYAQFLADLRAHVLAGGPKPREALGMGRGAWGNRSGSDIAALDEEGSAAVPNGEAAPSGAAEHAAKGESQSISSLAVPCT